MSATINIQTAAQIVAAKFGLDVSEVQRALQQNATQSVPAYQAFVELVCDRAKPVPNTALRPFAVCQYRGCGIYGCQFDHEYKANLHEQTLDLKREHGALIEIELERALKAQKLAIKLLQESNPETPVWVAPANLDKFNIAHFVDRSKDKGFTKRTLGDIDLTHIVPGGVGFKYRATLP
jgi:hypothetical protein